MFKLILVLAAIYIVLKIINTNAKLNERDARLAAEEEARRAEEAEFEEEEMVRAEAVDVEPEVVEEISSEEEVE